MILRCYLGQLCYSGQHKYNCAAATSRNVRRNKSQQAAYGAVSRLVAADVGCIAWDPSLLLLRSAITDIAANFLRSYCAPPRPPSADSHRAAGACCALCSCCALCACCASSRVERPIAAPRCLLRLIAAYCRARGATCSWYPPTTGRSRATTPAAPAPRPSSPSAPTPRRAPAPACCGHCGLLRSLRGVAACCAAPVCCGLSRRARLHNRRPRRGRARAGLLRSLRLVAVVAGRSGHCGELRLVAPRPSAQSVPTPRRAPAHNRGLLRSLLVVSVIAELCGLSRRARPCHRPPRARTCAIEVQ